MPKRKNTKNAAAAIMVFTIPIIALAQVSSPSDNIGGSVGLGTANLKTVIVNVISLALSFVGLVSVVMIILGGFQWMVSAGNEERIARAKKTISGAIVGIIIVLLAWAIVTFVAGTTKNVTT